MSSPSSKDAAKVELVEVIVAAGRTIDTGKAKFGPGKKVSLPADEVERFRATGYIVDPNAKELPSAEGPTFASSAGPTINAG
jgi:hypothetical protein